MKWWVTNVQKSCISEMLASIQLQPSWRHLLLPFFCEAALHRQLLYLKTTPTTIFSFCSTLTSFFSLGPLCSLHFAEHLYSAPFHRSRLPAGTSVLSGSPIIWPMSRYQLLCSERCNGNFSLFGPHPSKPHTRLVASHRLSSPYKKEPWIEALTEKPSRIRKSVIYRRRTPVDI